MYVAGFAPIKTRMRNDDFHSADEQGKEAQRGDPVSDADDGRMPGSARFGRDGSSPAPAGAGDKTKLMPTLRLKPKTIDEYITLFSPEVQAILERMRMTIRKAAPEAQEAISYNIPAFKLNGILVYFAAFKKHIGLYPPIRGDAKIEKAIAKYAGKKGNLQFPLDQPMPYGLIERIVKLRVKQNSAKARAAQVI